MTSSARSLVLAILMTAVPAYADAPDWWQQRGVISPGATADDYAVANLGQLKFMAQQAGAQMEVVLPGGAGSEIRDLLSVWQGAPGSGTVRDDYAAVNLGQLKTVASKFYTRLQAVGYQGQPLAPGATVPWAGTGADDYALANLGQLKHVFSFILVSLNAQPMGGQNGLFWRNSTGTLFSWGPNPQGLLGRAVMGLTVPTPGPVPLPKPVAGSASGRAHGLAVLSDGQVYTWGDNEFGQLGDGTRVTKSTPQLVPLLTNVTQVAAGESHSVALRNNGSVWTWGANQRGQLGAGGSSTAPRLAPAQVADLPVIVHIAAGARHTLALDASGKVWAWGANDFGQLGLASGVQVTTPTEVAGVSGAVSIAAGRHHSAAIIAGGVPVLWGAGYSGQLGHGQRAGSSSPVSLTTLTNQEAISLGAAHTLSLGVNGVVNAWGAGARGQLAPGGAGPWVDRAEPQLIPAFAGTGEGVIVVTDLSAGARHGLARAEDGQILVWGDNADGRLGLPTAPAVVSAPTPISLP